MAENTKIQWTDFTFNPWLGCSKVSAGCQHCYAENMMDTRYGKVQWGPSGTRVRTSDANWRKPMRWNREADGATARPRVFCASLADVFEDWDGPVLDSHGNEWFVCDNCLHHDTMPATTAVANPDGQPCIGDDPQPGCWMRPLTLDDLRRDLFALIDATPNLDWQLVTKRPENIRRMWQKATHELYDDGELPIDAPSFRRNVWLLTSVENQETADKRIPELLKCRDLAPVLGLSMEPLLGPVDLSAAYDEWWMSNGIDWVIVGGESGHGARPCDVAWIRLIVEQCGEAGIPCFVKQLGAKPFERQGGCSRWPVGTGIDFNEMRETLKVTYQLQDHKGGDPSEWPEDLRVRQFPEAVACR